MELFKLSRVLWALAFGGVGTQRPAFLIEGYLFWLISQEPVIGLVDAIREVIGHFIRMARKPCFFEETGSFRCPFFLGDEEVLEVAEPFASFDVNIARLDFVPTLGYIPTEVRKLS